MAGERARKRAVSFVVREPGCPERFLVVRRPADDPELPDVWGLPAGSLRAGEEWGDAVVRAGAEKLGVRLRVGRELNRGTQERRDYTLEMRLFEAEIEAGEPSVPQPHPGVTQYVEWRWGDAALLCPAADLGSLCCRLYLETVDRAAG